MELINLVEVIFGGAMLLLSIAFTITIRKNNENIFFSMRSSNLMIVTNILICLSIITYILNDLFYEGISYFLIYYFIFQITILVALSLRYFRLYLSCRNPEMDKVQLNMFEPKSYHYEYFYIRLLAIAIVIIVAVTTLVFFLIEGKIMCSHEILFIKSNDTDIIEKCYYFWIIFSFFETMVFLTFFLLIAKTNLNPQVYINREIFLVALIKYIYSLSMIISFFYLKEENQEYIQNTINFIPIVFNILIYFVVIALPFIYGIFNKTVIIYDLPGELCSTLYLFLTKEKCFDAFYSYLKEQDALSPDSNSHFYLDLLISIFKYRLLFSNNESNILLIQEIHYIKNHYLNVIDFNTDSVLKKDEVIEVIRACDKAVDTGPIKANIFDKIAGVIYEFLNKKFDDFKNDGKFTGLQNELNEETNIRCKLTNFGLIRN